MEELGCPFRQDVRRNDQSESASCDFLARLTGADKRFCRVDRTACEICVLSSPLSPTSLNPVMPSLLLNVCEAAFPDSPESSPEGLLKSWALRTVERDGRDALVPATYACDAVLVLRSDHSDVAIVAAAESVLNQDGVHVHLHLFATGDSVIVPPQIAGRPNVSVHRTNDSTDDSAVDVVDEWQILTIGMSVFQTPYVAWVDADSTSVPNRLLRSIDTIEHTGAEIFAAAVDRVDPVDRSCDTAGRARQKRIEPSTLVMRRSTLAECGAVRHDNLREWLRHAIRQRCELQTSGEALVRFASIDRCGSPVVVFDETDFVSDADCVRSEIRHVGPRLTGARPRCDVVLPFRDGFDFVQQSMEGLLQQRDADLIIHLIDDASDEAPDELFARYADRENVRCYRNRINLGPFATFNNLCDFAETDLIAVQDADDISLPFRFAHCCRLLESADADLVAGATELFGDQRLIEEICFEMVSRPDGERVGYRRSRYPNRDTWGYFLENPTLVMRRDRFIALGGFGDFGEGKRNRTGVDTDFQLRAFYARAAIAITREVVLRYRCHGGSATNHSDSGMGSVANLESQQEVARRFRRYAQGSFDPRWFGAIGRHRGITQRWSPTSGP